MRGYTEDTEALQKRLRRIEGQVRGCSGWSMRDLLHRHPHPDLGDDEALEAVAMNLLEAHLHHCVHDAIAAGDPAADDKITEAVEAVRRLVRS